MDECAYPSPKVDMTIASVGGVAERFVFVV
jgi:hypothetical protein